jgi:hypothetical protein
MLRKLRKTVREKLDHVDSRLSSPQDDASVGQPGSHIVSRDGGGLQPADFPTQTDFFKFRKQRGVNLGALYAVPIRKDFNATNLFQAPGLCWNAGLQIARFGKLTHPGKVTSTSPGEHMPERFCRTIGEIGSLKVTGPGLLKQESTPSVFR